MDGTRRRAIAAGLRRDGEALSVALTRTGWTLAGSAESGAEALGLLRSLQPELAVIDAILPGMDGVAFVRRARRLKLNVQPVILLLKPRGLRIPGEEALPGLGALAAEASPSAEALGRAIGSAAALAVPLPGEKAARLEALLDALGIPAHPGRACLARAVALAWADRRRLNALKRELYPAVAAGLDMQPAQAERAIRRVIDDAWRTGEIEQQHRIFGDTIDARRGKPTSGEMIAQLADILRWEG